MEPFDYEPVLDRDIQNMMLEELNRDLTDERLYSIPPRLTEQGRSLWKVMLYTAFREGASSSLERQLSHPGMMIDIEASKTSHSGTKKVPYNAAQTLAQGAFNRYYMRAICQYAIQEGKLVEVYRARSSENERRHSHDFIGQKVFPQVMMEYLEGNPDRHDPELPFGPNSGLSLRIAS